jgi:glycosyltransferase involved in cell wall biosynthesis
MRKFTILHTIETAGPGGAETVVLNLASRLDSSRFRSLVLLPREDWLSERLRERGVPTFFVDSKAWYDFRLPVGMARLIRQENVNLIHSHLPGQNFYSCVVGPLTGCKTIVTYHGGIELSRSRGLRGAIQLGWVRRSADAVVVVCDHVGQMLRNARFPFEKIVRIYNGISVEKFQVPANGRLRRELGLQNGAKLVGMVANLRETKGYEFFIQAARKVTDTMPETRFVAVGDMNPVIARPLLGLVERLGLQDRFIFLGFRSDVPEILSELDVFVLSSISEGFPLVALEAMAAAKPVIVTRSGGPQEIVEDGRTGLLIPPADPDALTEKICELFANPERAAALARTAREKVGSTFTLEKMIGNYEHLYERLMNGR